MDRELKTLYQLVRTSADRNGNSRTSFFIYSTSSGNVLAVLEAGAEGSGVLSTWSKKNGVEPGSMSALPTMHLPPRSYKDLLRFYARYVQ